MPLNVSGGRVGARGQTDKLRMDRKYEAQPILDAGQRAVRAQPKNILARLRPQRVADGINAERQ